MPGCLGFAARPSAQSWVCPDSIIPSFYSASYWLAKAGGFAGVGSQAHNSRATSMARVKLRLIHESSGVQHNDQSSNLEELCARVASRLQGSSFQLVVSPGPRHKAMVLQGDEGWQVLVKLYNEGVREAQSAATFRVRVYVRQPVPAQESQQPQQPASTKPHVRRSRPSQHQADTKRRKATDLVASTTSQEDVHANSHQSKHQTPQPAIGTTDWDEQVLQSIKRTVSKLHFGSRLTAQPPPA